MSYRGINPFYFPDEHPYPYRVKYPARPSYRCRDCGNRIGKDMYEERRGQCPECYEDTDRERRTCYNKAPDDNYRPRVVADVAVQLGIVEGE